jgi:outer membrane protein TolC
MLSDFQSRSLQDPGLKKFLEQNLGHELSPWPPATWDLNLLTLVAFYYHPDLDVARAKWGISKAAILTAGGRPNPTVSFVPEYVSNSDMGSPWIFGFTFDIPIETAGKRGYRIAVAQHQAEMARLNIATVAWQVRSRLRKNLLDLYAARARQRFLKEEGGLQAENYRLLETRAAQNSVSKIVTSEAQLQLNQTELSLSEEQKKEAEALAQVATSLGLPLGALSHLRFSFDSFAQLPREIPLAQWRREALFNRPDLLAGLAEYAAAESSLQLEIAKQYPDIHIAPGYSFDQGQNKWALGISITPPLFNQNKGPIAEAKAKREEIAARFNALQIQVVGEVEQAWASYQASLKKVKVAESLLQNEKKKRELVNSLNSEGEIRRVSLYETEVENVSADLSRLDAWVQAQQSLGQLEDAMERPARNGGSISRISETNPRPQENEKNGK